MAHADCQFPVETERCWSLLKVTVIVSWSWQSIHGVESHLELAQWKRHAMHQQKSNRNMPWHTFCAASVLSESLAHFPKPDGKALRAKRKRE